MLGIVEKRPTERKDYDIGFSRWLTSGDLITAATATIAGGTATIDAVEWSDTQVKIWITGGTAGDTGEVEVTATTLQGRIEVECFRLRVKEC